METAQASAQTQSPSSPLRSGPSWARVRCMRKRAGGSRRNRDCGDSWLRQAEGSEPRTDVVSLVTTAPLILTTMQKGVGDGGSGRAGHRPNDDVAEMWDQPRAQHSLCAGPGRAPQPTHQSHLCPPGCPGPGCRSCGCPHPPCLGPCWRTGQTS